MPDFQLWPLAVICVLLVISYAKDRKPAPSPACASETPPASRHRPIAILWQPGDDLTAEEVTAARKRIQRAMQVEMAQVLAERRHRIEAPRFNPNACPTCNTVTTDVRKRDGARWCTPCDRVFFPEGRPTPGL